MKKLLTVILILSLISCGGNDKASGPAESGEPVSPATNTVDYTLAEKLAGKKFSYFTQDIEAGDEEVLFKESIEFKEINKEKNIISLEIKDFKGNTSLSEYDIVNNTINGKKLNTEKIDAIREFDKEFTYNGKAYENCNQNMKWAKLLEGNTYAWSSLKSHKICFKEIDVASKTIKMLPRGIRPIIYFDIINKVEISKATETASPLVEVYEKITETSFKIVEQHLDGNGSTYIKEN